ncbi:hypothetical protein C8Q73DRAFT_787057 [Cubamyces lactineus]|nr:hypothetical protein C8Q73DRAFT_787057 [Cubamyces lactineus]
MGKIDQAVLDDFDSLAVALGSTPKFNNQNEIIPIGARDPRGKVYVVWIGRGIGLFYNWGLTGAMVKGFPGAMYKSFHSLEDARRGWYGGPRSVSDWTPPAPRPAVLTPTSKQREPEAQLHIPTPIHPPPLVHVRLPADVAVESDSSDDDIGDDSKLSGHRAPHSASVPSLLTPGTVSAATIPTPPSEASTPSKPTKARPLKVTMTAKGFWGAKPASPASKRVATSSRTTADPPATTGRDSPELSYDRVRVRKGEYVFVVLRGDLPGIYFDRTTALVSAGCRPGMKIVPFKSLSRAAWFFTQQSTKHRVGVPVVDVSDNE